MGEIKQRTIKFDVNGPDPDVRFEPVLCVSPGREHGPIIERTGDDAPRMRSIHGTTGYSTDPELQRLGTRFISDELKSAEISRELAHLIFVYRQSGSVGDRLLQDAIGRLPTSSSLRTPTDSFIRFVCGSEVALDDNRRLRLASHAEPASPLERALLEHWKRHLNLCKRPEFSVATSTQPLLDYAAADAGSARRLTDEQLVAELEKWLVLLENDVGTDSHLSAFINRHAISCEDAKQLSYQGCGDLTMNYWSVAFLAEGGASRFVCPLDEPVEDRTYSSLVKWHHPPPGRPRVEIVDLKYNRYAVNAEEQVLLAADQGMHAHSVPVGDCVAFAVSGQQIVRDGRPLDLKFTIHQFPDVRHILELPNLNPSDELSRRMPMLREFSPHRPRTLFNRVQFADVWLGEAALLRDRNLRRAALTGSVLLPIEAVGASPQHIEAALYSSGPENQKHYQQVTSPLQDLEPGQYRIVREGREQWYEIYFRRSVYPVSALGIDADGKLVSFAWTGDYGDPRGFTVEDVARKLASQENVVSAILIDEGADVFQHDAQSSSLLDPSRPKVRAMFIHVPCRLLAKQHAIQTSIDEDAAKSVMLSTRTSPRATLAKDHLLEGFRMSMPLRQASLEPLFSDAEIDILTAARQSVEASSATVAYCVYENPFAKSGGIFAVADNYCSTLSAQGRAVVVLSPFHSMLKTAPVDATFLRCVGRCEVTFGGSRVGVELMEHMHNGVRWILLRADGFFEADGGDGGTDPYVHSGPSRLLTDSLFACAAVPHALARLDLRQNVLVHAQDWEFASTALTVKQALVDGILDGAAVVLTSHNPYDHDLPASELHKLTDRVHHGSQPHDTVYQYMIPLTDAPVTTVSRTFATELTIDPLQTSYFANHLQPVLRRQGVVGVDNGLFGQAKPVFSDRAIREAKRGNPEPILQEKLHKRKAMLAMLSHYQDSRILGGILAQDSQPLSALSDDVPVFMMFGRLDPGQKGFDVLAHAIHRLPKGMARFVLTPIVGSAPPVFRDQLADLAKARQGEVVVYPFRMQQGYMETMSGATFAVMPSIYEPFGAATEPYLAGTPVVARRTGGLVQQVTDLAENGQKATGILYRETQLTDGNLGQQWRISQDSDPASRLHQPIYTAMVDSLAQALAEACDVYRNKPEAYGRMLANLLEKARQFSWDRGAKEYGAVYGLVTDNSTP